MTLPVWRKLSTTLSMPWTGSSSRSGEFLEQKKPFWELDVPADFDVKIRKKLKRVLRQLFGNHCKSYVWLKKKKKTSCASIKALHSETCRWQNHAVGVTFLQLELRFFSRGGRSDEKFQTPLYFGPDTFSPLIQSRRRISFFKLAVTPSIHPNQQENDFPGSEIEFWQKLNIDLIENLWVTWRKLWTRDGLRSDLEERAGKIQATR